MRLKDKVCLITGAGSGIGRASALRFAQEGAKVVGVDINGQEAIATQQQILQAGGVALALPLDVTQEVQIQEAITTTVSRFGRIDVLFNNAGIARLIPTTEMTEAQWDQIMNVNVKGIFLGCKHAIPIMVRQGSGVIINTASELGLVAQAEYAAYCASKGAVLSLTRALSLEWVQQGIRINAICPGPVMTPLLEGEFNSAADPVAEQAAVIRQIPAGRLGTPEEIAQVALFLASDEASFMHGTAVTVDGGKTIH